MLKEGWFWVLVVKGWFRWVLPCNRYWGASAPTRIGTMPCSGNSITTLLCKLSKKVYNLTPICFSWFCLLDYSKDSNKIDLVALRVVIVNFVECRGTLGTFHLVQVCKYSKFLTYRLLKTLAGCLLWRMCTVLIMSAVWCRKACKEGAMHMIPLG